jgi:hypothetical protein
MKLLQKLHSSFCAGAVLTARDSTNLQGLEGVYKVICFLQPVFPYIDFAQICKIRGLFCGKRKLGEKV